MSITFTATNAPEVEAPLTICMCAQDVPSFCAIVDGEVSVQECAEEVARHAWDACPRCKGTGMEEDYVPDPHELNVSYGADSILMRMLGIDPEPCGIIHHEELPRVIRTAMRALNSEKTRRPFILSSSDVTGGYARAISPGVDDDRLCRYAQRFLELAHYAQNLGESITWG